jgi:hypothetical protein
VGAVEGDFAKKSMSIQIRRGEKKEKLRYRENNK